MYDYSVVVPVFNSEYTLVKLFESLTEVFAGLSKSVQFVFVDDGSGDNSWEVLKGIKQTNSKDVVIVRLNKNYGQGNASFCGFKYAKGGRVITIDDDLQQPPEEIPKMIDLFEQEKLELVYGVYKHKKHSVTRNLGSKVVRKSARKFFDKPEMASSFRLISSKITQKVLPHKSNFIFVDELLWWYTDKISFAFVEHRKREGSKSGYTYGKLWKLLANLLIHYTNFPLRLMVYGGLFFSILFLFVTVYYLMAKAFYDVPLGYTSIIVGIMLSTSMILFSLGVIGEYVSRLYTFQNKKPPFIVEELEE
ncbi:MAG: glycosyltransferase family 2 protein [Bacteroidales bacterium]|nr:glycosyltransferase family 2 protein [Bacteroidales bacterium]